MTLLNYTITLAADVAWKNRPPKKSPKGDFLTDDDREIFATRRFIHDRL